MRRRDFVTFLGGAMTWMSAARGQEPRHVIGFLSGSSDAMPGTLAAFYQGLKETGFVERKNLGIEFRWAGGQYDRLPSLAAELVARNVSVIVAHGVPSAFAAKEATKTIPVVFVVGADPVKLGLVDSFNQPRGSLTGVSIFAGALGPKQLELLHELLPNSRTVGLLLNPSNLNSQIDTPAIQAAADAMGQHLEVLTASTENELEPAFTTMVRQRVDALVVRPDQFLISQRERLVALAAHHAIPAIYPIRSFVDFGGLLSYGAIPWDAYRQMGTYTGRILKGEKLADLPVQQSIKFELVINLKTAKSPWSHRAAGATRPRRRGDRIRGSLLQCNYIWVRNGPTRTGRLLTYFSRRATTGPIAGSWSIARAARA
jgi:putative tryptophan/tyrosine transport system substrate-binding protein